MHRIGIGTIRAIVNFFWWHPIVREYYIGRWCDSNVAENKLSTKEKYKLGWLYIKNHGNSFWAKLDYIAGEIRGWIFMIILLISLALFLGWRP